jgi:hypothetical protein
MIPPDILEVDLPLGINHPAFSIPINQLFTPVELVLFNSLYFGKAHGIQGSYIIIPFAKGQFTNEQF